MVSWFSRAIALLDALSGYFLLALTVAGAIILMLPPTLVGVNITTFREIWGVWVLISTILFGCLWVAKLARWLFDPVRRMARKRRLFLIYQPSRSFWAPGPAAGPIVTQVHINFMLTNQLGRSLSLSNIPPQRFGFKVSLLHERHPRVEGRTIAQGRARTVLCITGKQVSEQAGIHALFNADFAKFGRSIRLGIAPR